MQIRGRWRYFIFLAQKAQLAVWIQQRGRNKRHICRFWNRRRFLLVGRHGESVQ
jgi:hypothetical protein